MTLNLGSLLHNTVRSYSGETALIWESERFTYAELDRRVRQFAAELLDAGIERGDRVAIMAPNGPEFTIAYFAILYAGGIVVTLNTLQTADEVTFLLQDCQASALVLHADCGEVGINARKGVPTCLLYFVGGGSQTGEVAETKGESPFALPDNARRFEQVLRGAGVTDFVQTMPDDTAVIQYTSGTTGKPKGAELTHFNLFYNAQFVCERAFSVWPDTINILGPGQVGLAALPLYHTFGQTNVQNAMLFGGGAISYLSRFTPATAVAAIARDRVTFFPAVPTMYFAILHDDSVKSEDVASLQFCVSGGAPMPVEVKQKFERQFDVRIQEGYGLTETSPLATVQRLDETAKCGTIGKPIAGVEVKIFAQHDHEVPQGETGEIVIRGHNIMKGYYKRAEATRDALRGGWFHSGDIGYADPEGDIFVVDRKKDMILRGGYNVFPREVEEVLYTHPAVREAAVIGIPNDRYGEEVKAVISLKPGCQASEDEIQQFCKQRVAAYKYPRVISILDELPKGPTGKILKRALRE